MKTPLVAQISFTALIAIAMAYVTFYEWRKVGFLSDRESEAVLSAFNDRTSKVPKEIPNWTLVTDDKNIDPAQLGAAGITNFFTRSYRSKETDDVVDVFFSTGPTQHVSVHTPAVCYPGQGAEEIDHESITETLQDKTKKERLGTLLHQKFRVSGNVQDIWWAFNQDGTWIGAKDPRSEFYKPALYKIYIITYPERTKKSDEPPQIRFMRDFIPVSQPILFPKDPEKIVTARDDKAAAESEEKAAK